MVPTRSNGNKASKQAVRQAGANIGNSEEYERTEGVHGRGGGGGGGSLQ